MSNDKLMIQKQAEIISRLNESIRDINRLHQRELAELETQLEKFKSAGQFYLRMQEEIIASPVLQSEWDRFLALLKMSMENPKELGE